MEISAHYPSTTTSTIRSFDSTDKILDEIDAKLNGVANLEYVLFFLIFNLNA